jgi:hypothetical protein
MYTHLWKVLGWLGHFVKFNLGVFEFFIATKSYKIFLNPKCNISYNSPISPISKIGWSNVI